MAPPTKKKTAVKTTRPRAAKKAVAPTVLLEPDQPVAAPVSAGAASSGETRRQFLHAVGRRKTSTASVRLMKNGSGIITVNHKPVLVYFPVREFHEAVRSPLISCGQSARLDVEAEVHGGGVRGQADAVKLGVARALLQLNPTFRKNLRKSGMLTRDPRAKERKKYGLKKARRAPQWQKR